MSAQCCPRLQSVCFSSDDSTHYCPPSIFCFSKCTYIFATAWMEGSNAECHKTLTTAEPTRNTPVLPKTQPRIAGVLVESKSRHHSRPKPTRASSAVISGNLWGKRPVTRCAVTLPYLSSPTENATRPSEIDPSSQPTGNANIQQISKPLPGNANIQRPLYNTSKHQEYSCRIIPFKHTYVRTYIHIQTLHTNEHEITQEYTISIVMELDKYYTRTIQEPFYYLESLLHRPREHVWRLQWNHECQKRPGRTNQTEVACPRRAYRLIPRKQIFLDVSISTVPCSVSKPSSKYAFTN